MAGFEKFMNDFLGDGGSGKPGLGGGLNSILEKINEAAEAAKAANGNQSNPQPRKSKTNAGKRTKKQSKPKDENRAESMEQKRAASNELIMKHSLENKAHMNSKDYDMSNFNFDIDADSMIQGIIFSEILDKPLSKRGHRGGLRARRNW